MALETALGGTEMYRLQGFLIVPVPAGIYGQQAVELQQAILERVKGAAVKGLVFDVSRVTIIDSSVARILSGTAKMAALLGARTVLAGFRPGVVAALIDLDIDFDGLPTAPTLDAGIRDLKSEDGAQRA
ncbi:MAG: STAS domain-containing protein [Deltaproteobacteria bacterium]|nr:STAS domain-containing protein [Deltaproteobacteria bacterium]